MLLLVVVVVVGDEQDYWMHFSTVREVANESLFRKIVNVIVNVNVIVTEPCCIFLLNCSSSVL